MRDASSATIIVTPRERFSLAERALHSVLANTPAACPLIYVATGAPSDLVSYVRAQCAGRTLELIEGAGFRAPNAARNLGLARAATDYVIFLDNDVVVEPGWVEALIGCAEEQNTDLVSPLCLIGEPEDLNLHSAGGKLIAESRADGTWLQESHHYGPISLRTSGQRLTRMESDYSEFHCMLVRRSVFDRIGMLDEKIEGAAEHIDLALHLRAIGSSGFFEPLAVVSYLPSDYLLADLEPYSRRWSVDWFFNTMAHLAQKWELAPDSGLLRDYRLDFYSKRERCLLSLETLPAPLPARARELTTAQTIVQLLDQMSALGYEPEDLTRIADGYLVAGILFGGSFRASGRTFLAHLVGTASILASFGANPAVVLAGLLHAAYTHGTFPEKFGASVLSMRRWLRRRIGEAAETLVFVQSWQDLTSVTPALEQPDTVPVNKAAAALIRLANGIEDRSGGDHRYFDSAAWLQASNAAIRQWMPAYRAFGERLGMPQMATILQDLIDETDAERPNVAMPARPLNFILDRDSGAIMPLGGRAVREADGRDPEDIAAWGRSRPVALSAITTLNGGVIAREDDGILLQTSAVPWAYAARLDIAALGQYQGRGALVVRLRVDRGIIGVLLLERGSAVNTIGLEQHAGASPEQVTLAVEIEALEEAGVLYIRTWPNDDGAATVHISSIELRTAR